MTKFKAVLLTIWTIALIPILPFFTGCLIFLVFTKEDFWPVNDVFYIGTRWFFGFIADFLLLGIAAFAKYLYTSNLETND